MFQYMRTGVTFVVLALTISCSFTEKKATCLAKTDLSTTKINTAPIPAKAKQILQAYPDIIIGYEQNQLIWYDSTTTLFDDGMQKSFEQKMTNADTEDQLSINYPWFEPILAPTKNYDPGRIRNTNFFKKMYGHTATQVRNNLATVIWLPQTKPTKIKATRINGVNNKLQALSNILDTMPHLHPFIDKPAGGFYWRPISGTERLSAHSFGISIDINVKPSHYWRWSNKANIEFKNNIPAELVHLFERFGFVWGGRWYHYDTMHFEYRPELHKVPKTQ